MRLVSNQVSHAFAEKVAETGVTVAEWVVLREMYRDEGMTPSRLAELTGLTRGAVSKLTDRLFVKKLLTRTERGEDRRYQDVALTAAGKRLIPVLAALADKNDAQFFACLTAGEREDLTRLLKKIAQAHSMRTIPVE
jgi:DNA-binding MarR family transcriptional regulator